MKSPTLFVLTATLTLLTGCGEAPAPPAASGIADPLSGLVIDRSRITVSGLSSGGFMASQLHVALSATFSAAGIIAAGPWQCARGDISRALNLCVKGGDFEPDRTLAAAQALAEAGRIDPLENLQGDPVWLFRGSNDVAIAEPVVDAAATLYAELSGSASVVTVRDVPAAHGLPTVDSGLACSTFGEPYINACDYDLAGIMLQHLSGIATEAATPAGGEVFQVPVKDAKAASLREEASIYVPTQCAQGNPCGVHVALHGCQQSSEKIGDAFIMNTGYNRWADALDLVVVYPQVASSSFAPMNPLGCWDWWGYTGADYTDQTAPQIAAIKNLLDSLGSKQP